MEQKLALLGRDQYSVLIAVRQIVAMIEASIMAVHGTRSVEIEVPHNQGLDDIGEVRSVDGERRAFFSQVKKQTTTLDTKHIDVILKRLNDDKNQYGCLIVSEDVAFKYLKEEVSLRTLRELCERAGTKGITCERFLEGLSKEKNNWIDYCRNNLGLSNETLFDVLRRCEVEFSGSSIDIEKKCRTSLANFFENDKVFDLIHSYVNRKIEHPKVFTFELVLEEILKDEKLRNVKSVVRISESDSSYLLATNRPFPSVVRDFWGEPSEVHCSSDVQCLIDYNRRPTHDEAFGRVLVRLFAHSKKNVLNVAKEDEWRNFSNQILGNCVGVQVAVQPWLVRDINKSIVERSAHMDQFSLSYAKTYSSVELAKAISSQMDDWCWAHLCTLVEEELLHKKTQLGLIIEANLCSEMLTLWRSWQVRLNENDSLRLHLMQTIVSTVADQRKHGNVGTLRLGPLTIRSCHLASIVFALAVSVALGNGFPNVTHAHANLGLGENVDFLSHIVGLEYSAGFKIGYFIEEILAEELVLPLLVYGEFLSITDAAKTSQSLKAINSPNNCFRNLTSFSGISIPFDDLFKKKMKLGKNELAMMLKDRFSTEAKEQVKIAMEGIA